MALHIDHHFTIAQTIAKILDDQFEILGFKFGLDPIVGFIPFWGDLAGLMLALYIVWIGNEMGVPNDRKIEMVGNVAMDFLIGLIPILGDAADFAFKANKKNIEIIRAHRKTFVDGEIVRG